MDIFNIAPANNGDMGEHNYGFTEIKHVKYMCVPLIKV